MDIVTVSVYDPAAGIVNIDEVYFCQVFMVVGLLLALGLHPSYTEGVALTGVKVNEPRVTEIVRNTLKVTVFCVLGA